jgi:hypothetical protein
MLYRWFKLNAWNGKVEKTEKKIVSISKGNF